MASNIFTTTQFPEDDFRNRRMLSVKEFLKWSGISRFLFYKLVKDRKISPSKIGRRTVILWEECERFARDLPKMGERAGADELDQV